MAEHFTDATEYVIQWCETCRRMTEHGVSGHRVGRCREHQAKTESAAQKKRRERESRERQNPKLF